jgi:hypothetical protein
MFRTHTPVIDNDTDICRLVVSLPGNSYVDSPVDNSSIPPPLQSIKLINSINTIEAISELNNQNDQKQIDGRSVFANIEEFTGDLGFNNSLSFTQKSEFSSADERSSVEKTNDILSGNGCNRFDLTELSKNKKV